MQVVSGAVLRSFRESQLVGDPLATSFESLLGRVREVNG